MNYHLGLPSDILILRRREIILEQSRRCFALSRVGDYMTLQ